MQVAREAILRLLLIAPQLAADDALMSDFARAREHVNEPIAPDGPVSEPKTAEVVGLVLVERPIDELVALLGLALLAVVSARGEEVWARFGLANLRGDGVHD